MALQNALELHTKKAWSPGRRATHIVILEGMEEVASQFAIISWSARGIANATYVVWRILQETGDKEARY